MAVATRGPLPKRSDQRRRKNLEVQPDIVVLPSVLPSVEHPPADQEWYQTVKGLYESLALSGQAQFYEPSDWAFAYMTCDILSRGLIAERMPAMLIASCMADLSRLGVTEGDRRRMRVELQRNPEGVADAKVFKLAKYQSVAK